MDFKTVISFLTCFSIPSFSKLLMLMILTATTSPVSVLIPRLTLQVSSKKLEKDSTRIAIR